VKLRRRRRKFSFTEVFPQELDVRVHGRVKLSRGVSAGAVLIV